MCQIQQNENQQAFEMTDCCGMKTHAYIQEMKSMRKKVYGQ